MNWLTIVLCILPFLFTISNSIDEKEEVFTIQLVDVGIDDAYNQLGRYRHFWSLRGNILYRIYRYVFEKDFVCTTISVDDRKKLCNSMYRKLRETSIDLLRTKDIQVADVDLDEKQLVCAKRNVNVPRKDKSIITITQKVLPCVFNEKSSNGATNTDKKSDRIYVSQAYQQPDKTRKYVLVYKSSFNENNVEMPLELIKRTEPGIPQQEFGKKNPTTPAANTP